MDSRVKDLQDKVAALELSVANWKAKAQTLQSRIMAHACVHCSLKLDGDPVMVHDTCLHRLESLAAVSEGERAHLRQLTEASHHMAKFLRENYSLEISAGQPQHKGEALDAAIHYMGIERRRWSVRLRYVMRWIMGGGQ